MAARIPQLYEPPRTRPSQDPFASTDNLPSTTYNEEAANLSNIGSLLRGAAPGDAPDHAALHARVRELHSLSDEDFSDAGSYYGPGVDRDSRINAGAIGGLGLGGMGPPASSSGFGGVGGTKPLQVRSQSPAPSTRGRQQHGPPGGPVVVNFPTPNLVPSPTGFPSTPSTASYTSSSPGGVAVGQLQQQQRAVKVQLPIIANSQPVAPILAAPPKAHFAGGAGGDAPASPQLRGFDSMKEKAATFREDDTEVLNPFSPYARQEGPRRVGRSNLNPNGRKTLFRPYSTVDFWKRFSTMGRVHEQQGKESTWITERKRSIWSKPLFVVPLILTICAVGAIIAYLAIKLSKTTSAGSPEVSAASR